LSYKKILYVIPYFAPAWTYGGTVRATFELAKELTRQGCNITVATTDVLDEKSRNRRLEEKIEGIEIIRFRNISNFLARKFNFYAPVGFRKWLVSNIKNYDLVHIHELFTYQSVLAISICHKLGKRFVVQPHGSLSQFAQKSRFSFLKSLILKKLSNSIRSASAIIVLNQKEKQATENVFTQLSPILKIAPNGIDLSEFRNISKIDIHSRYGITPKNKIIAFIGRVRFIKGLDISLRALALIKNKLNFTFLIIGPDEGEKNNLERLARSLKIQDRIVFTGMLTADEKLQTLKSTDLSLLNSRSEGQPTTLLESAALGLPIICSPESNLPEVERFKAGFIVNSEKQTAQRIEETLKNNRLHRILSRNALDLAKSFDIKRCAHSLKEIYESPL